jgi:hypothetical protein
VRDVRASGSERTKNEVRAVTVRDGATERSIARNKELLKTLGLLDEVQPQQAIKSGRAAQAHGGGEVRST